MTAANRRSISLAPRVLLLCATPLWALALILRYGVDVPYWDQWEDTCPLLLKLHAGTLGLADMFQFHNEHRMFFPRVIALGLSLASHWNLRVEMLANWGLAWITVFNLCGLARATDFGKREAVPWFAVAMTFLVFNPVQDEIWISGASLQFLLEAVCLSGCLWLAAEAGLSAAFCGTFALATVATFSVASGFWVWVLTAPVLWLRAGGAEWKRRRGWWLVWGSAFVIEVILYFHGYRKPAQHPDPLLFFKEPLAAAGYILAFLGGGFGSTVAGASAAGAFLAAAFFLCMAALWTRRGERETVSRALPWAMLASYAFANALLAMIGRLGIGIGQALSTRYVTFSALLPAGLLFLVPLLVVERPLPVLDFSARRLAAFGFALVFACMELVRAQAAQPVYFADLVSRLHGKAALAYIDVAPDAHALDRLSYQGLPCLKAYADGLERLRCLRPGLIESSSIREVADPSARGDGRFGKIVLTRQVQSGQWLATGWAILPDQRRPADAVLLTVESGAAPPAVFALAKTGMPIVDVGRSADIPEYERAGWYSVVFAGALPAGATVKAWAFNVETRRACRLAGEMDLGSAPGLAGGSSIPAAAR